MAACRTPRPRRPQDHDWRAQGQSQNQNLDFCARFFVGSRTPPGHDGREVGAFRQEPRTPAQGPALWVRDRPRPPSLLRAPRRPLVGTSLETRGPCAPSRGRPSLGVYASAWLPALPSQRPPSSWVEGGGCGTCCSPGQAPLCQSRARYTAHAGVTALRGVSLEVHEGSIREELGALAVQARRHTRVRGGHGHGWLWGLSGHGSDPCPGQPAIGLGQILQTLGLSGLLCKAGRAASWT